MRRPSALLACALALWGCSGAAPAAVDAGVDAGLADAGPQVAVFIALDPDFAAYRSWPVVTLDEGNDPPHRIYLNHAPPHGSSQFPMGTILVKEMGSAATYDFEVDAMVKRGGGYNTDTDGGAPGWEFFGLAYLPDAGAPYIQWRGPGVWSAGNYAGSNQSCVTCHLASEDNDYVQTPGLSLGHF